MTREPRCTPQIAFPRPIHNRPGLDKVNYRIGSYADLREKMLHDLNNEPALAHFTHRGADDPAIALLEGAATLGDILTFYTDLYANEVWLRTATQRRAIAELVRLIDYRLAPGIGGGGAFAFEVKSDQAVHIPSGFPVKAKLDGMDTSAEFQTVHDLDAYPVLSQFHLYRQNHFPSFPSQTTQLSVETKTLEASGIQLKKKDRLMLLEKTYGLIQESSVVIIKDVETRFERTLLTLEGAWRGGLGKNKVHAFKLKRTFRHFGHNAPYEVMRTGQVQDFKGSSIFANNDMVLKSKANSATHEQVLAMNDGGGDDRVIVQDVMSNIVFISQIIPIEYLRQLNSPTASSLWTTVNPSISEYHIPLDQDVDDLSLGGSLIVTGIVGGAVVRSINAFRSASMTWGSLTGAVTMVTLDRDLHSDTQKSSVDIRNLVFHEAEGLSFEVTPPRGASSKAGGGSIEKLWYFGDDADWRKLDQRKLLIQSGDLVASTTAALGEPLVATGPTMREVILNPGLPESFTADHFQLDYPQTTVFGNIADVNQGKTQPEAVLGNGDSRRDFLTFKLPKTPLTWHSDSQLEPPRAPELDIYVDRIRWNRVETLYGQPPEAQVYIVREDDQGLSWVQFGDGKTGKRPPSGIRNITAQYRTGTGAFGPLADGEKVATGARIDGLKKVHLPGLISGGAEPEDGQSARDAAPGQTAALNRLVSLDDYRAYALAQPGVSRAAAAWGFVGQTPGLTLTLLMDQGREKEFQSIREALTQADIDRGMQRFPIQIVEGARKEVTLQIQVHYHPDYIRSDVDAAIQTALGLSGDKGLFHPTQRQFGQPEFASRIEGVVQNVAGVARCCVTHFYSIWPEMKVFPKLHCPPAQILHLPPENLSFNAATGGLL